jgi:hypothetical protein
MTVNDFAKTTAFKVITMPAPEREIDGAYSGDLLSWVMGKASAGNLWITIMSNVNIIAVATLSELSAIILAEGVTLDGDVLKTAEAKGVNVLSSSLPAFEIAKLISGIIC